MPGEAACLGAALFWAIAVTMFRPAIEKHGARTINLLKCTLATVLLAVTVLAAGQWHLVVGADRYRLFLVAFSGIVGITLGDTALLAAVVRIGPYRTLLLQTLAPIFTALLAAVWVGEILKGRQYAGAALVLTGVAMVVVRKSPSRGKAGKSAIPAAGIALAVLAAFGQGTGVVIADEGMKGVPVLGASFVRLASSALCLFIMGLVAGNLHRVGKVFARGGLAARIGAAGFIGTYIAILLMMAGIKMAPSPVAAVLLSVTPVFSLFLDAWTLGEKITLRGLAGTALAIAGIAVLSF